MKRLNHVYLKYNIMGKIIKENGKIWLEEIQDVYGNHKKMTMLETYDENEDVKEEKPKKIKRKKSN